MIIEPARFQRLLNHIGILAPAIRKPVDLSRVEEKCSQEILRRYATLGIRCTQLHELLDVDLGGNPVAVRTIEAKTGDPSLFAVQFAAVQNNSVVYQAKDGNWTIWTTRLGQPSFEIAVTYLGEEVKEGWERKAWITYDVRELGLDADAFYAFRDLVSGREYSFSGEILNRIGLRIGLNENDNRHHFLIFEKEGNHPPASHFGVDEYGLSRGTNPGN